MARLGVTESDIKQAIQALEAEGVALTVSSIRARLGTGSFTTISTVLQRYREERERAVTATVPELPKPLQGLFEQVWAEAWRQADAKADTERQAHAEMQAEIERLEKALADQAVETQEIKATLDAKTEALQNAEIQTARLQAALTAAQSEAQQAREGSVKMQEQLTSWVERATRAETKLEEAAKKDKRAPKE
jgi:chromosome segregation ATPase